ncbi:MAG: hypothetical protein AB7I30_21675 [Isosphaeraceae bacterium]
MRESSNTPGWLAPVLTVAHAPSRFRDACQRAVEGGAVLARMRLMRETSGPRPVPWERLVRDLAEAAGGSPEVVAERAGLRLDQEPGPDTSRAWGRFASGLGLTWREARLHLRLSVLEHCGSEPFLAVAARSSDPTDPLIVAEKEADAQAEGLEDSAVALLHDCEAAALDAYDADRT